jgi:hypothetical protein
MNNVPIAGAVGQIYVPAGPGQYAVALTTGNCSSISECYYFPTLSNNMSEFSQPRLYPNPTTGLLHIELPANSELKSVRVLDVLGKEVAHSLNLSALAKGLYWVELKTSNGVFIEKVLKQ